LYEVEEVDFDGFQIEFCGGGDCMIIMNQDQNCWKEVSRSGNL